MLDLRLMAVLAVLAAAAPASASGNTEGSVALVAAAEGAPLRTSTLQSHAADIAQADDGAEAVDADASDEDEGSGLGVELGAGVVSEYWWRGYVYEDRGAIVQPYIEWSASLIEGEEDDDVWVDLFVGSWNSFQSEKTDATGASWDAWYESDLYAGLAMGQGCLELDATYTAYLYPNNDDFDTVHELGLELIVDLDDESAAGRLLGDLRAGVFFEVDDSNVRKYDDEAVYAELGLGPTFELAEGAAELSLPVRLGISLDDYYVERNGRSRTFGFASFGAAISMPLDVSESFDATLSFGGTWHVLGNATEEINDGDHAGGFLFVALALEF